MKRLLFVIILFCSPALAQTSAVTNFCNAGASQAVTTGLRSTNYLQGVIPYCTVSVYNTGTVNLATIYSNAGSTPLTNPFKASQTGQWTFWGSTSACFDIQFTGGVIPNTYQTPVTLTDVCPGGGGGTGTTITAGTGIVVTGTPTTGYVISVSTPVTPLTIVSFTGGQAGELGQSFANPAFTASYTGTPTSANITNTASVDSPHVLTSPYTSGTLSGTLTVGNTPITVTLHASDGTNNPTATTTFTGSPRIFNGTGTTGGATGATTSGTSAVLVGDTGTLPSFQLGAETVGTTTFVYTGLTGQYVYLLLTGASHTFIDAGTGFPFAFNAPLAVTFVNAQGATVPMYLYQSTYPLYGNYTPKVAS